MKKITTLLLLSFAVWNVHSQSFIQAYQDRVNMISQANITANLQDFENLGIKTTGSTNNENTLNWIKNKYLSYGYSASQITEDPFTFNYLGTNINSKNLVITKTGTLYPDTYVIICAHFDTINGPGVNDNGSGTSILLEAARILKDIPTEYSIKFIHFSGEEQGLYGSSHYANNVAYQNNVPQFDIKLVFNIDEVGGKLGNNNNTIKCERDNGGQTENNAESNLITQQLATCTALYSPLQTVISEAYSSDYMPFEAKKEVITGFYENIESPYPHTANDKFANVDPVYVYNVGKAALGALQHFAVAISSTLGLDETIFKSSETVKIYPNPVKDILTVKLPKEIKNFSIEVNDLTGRSILKVVNQKDINLSGLVNGDYLCTVKTDEFTVTKKIIIN
uniref:M28 family peptidase n=1 Tax=Chryseobacterium sp. TaxID=1871047 RepID=UPI0025B7A984